MRTLAGLASGVTSGMDLEVAFGRMAANLLTLLHADRIVLMVASNAAGLTVRHVEPPLRNLLGRRVPPDSLPGLAAASGRVLTSPDGAGLRPRLGPGERGCPRRLAAPIRVRDRVDGVLLAGRRRTVGFSPAEVDLFTGCAEFVGVTLDNTRLALIDGVTGVYNHRHFQVLLGLEIERARRFGKEFTLLMMDVDDFKAINDRHGHLAGDRVLRGTAAAIGASIRRVDILARYGGEEFAVILPGTPATRGRAVAEKIRRCIGRTTTARAEGGEPIGISLSVGVAGFPGDGRDRESLIRAADSALYRAKAGGKNRVCAARQERRPPAQ